MIEIKKHITQKSFKTNNIGKVYEKSPSTTK